MTGATKLTFNNLLGDIRFWIILALLVRLYGITNPPLEVAHNWRQTTVTMAARNFFETDPNILYPRVDFAGEKSGITGMEFPLLNYLIYLASLIFGYDHWYGRLINLVVSSFGLLYFFRLLAKYFTRSIAFKATFVLIFSVWFAYSRKIMPDTFSVSLVMIGMYYGSNYLDRKANFKNLLLYSLFIMAGVLAKLPAGFLLVLFLPLLFFRHVAPRQMLNFIIASSLLLVPVGLWYFYWVPHLVEEYGFWHFFMGKSLITGVQEIAANFHDTIKKFYDIALKYIGFAFFLVGLVFAVVKKHKVLLTVFILSSAAFLVIMFKAGYYFSHHSYYIVPFVPVMALVCGYGIDQLKGKVAVIIVLSAIAVEGVLNQQHDFRIHKHEELLGLESTLDRFTDKDDLILINSGQNPTPIYFAHRKGWVKNNEEIRKPENISQLKDKGLDYILILKHGFGSPLPLDYPIVHQEDLFILYDVE